jgi:large subunit ribosomal protein L25
MELRKIAAARRNDHGKSPARRLRATDQIPAIAYGKELPATALAVSPKDLVGVLQSPHGRNSVIELEIEGQDKLTVLLNDYQYHPVTRSLLHADFFQIHMDRPVEVEVPFELTGKPVGVTLGGTLRQVFRKLPVRCLPSQIPVKLTHDVTNLNLNEHVFASNLSLPEGVVVTLPPTQTIAGIVSEKGDDSPAEAAAPAAAAPAKAAAAPAKAAEKKPAEKKGK